MDLNLNTATYVGIDSHTEEHTALAINRFEEEKGHLKFQNSHSGFNEFLSWLGKMDHMSENVIVGIEGGGWNRYVLLKKLLPLYQHVYEVNPLYTKQRRDYGPRRDKSDKIDAKLIASVLTRNLSELPKLTANEISTHRLIFKKTVWFYEEITTEGTKLQNQLIVLLRDRRLTKDRLERKSLDMMIKYKKSELARIKNLQKDLVKQFDLLLSENGSNLTTIPGVGIILAAKLVAHVNGIERFKNVDKFIRYAGISPVENSSGKTKRYMKGNRGNRKLNGTLYLGALSQILWNEKAKEYYEKKLKEGKTKKHALRCLMKHFAVLLYSMMKSKKVYEG